MPQVGQSIPRLEARDKVTGRAEYVHNLRLPGMLHGKIFRSTVAHGRIRAIDTQRARRSGQACIASSPARTFCKLIPDPYYGPAFHDQPILALDKVRYVGEPVAVVLAADPHVAEAARKLIEADYEELPAVFDEVEAMTSGVIVHDVLKPAGTFPDLKHLAGRRDTNVALDYHLRRGDVGQGASPAAEHVFEHTFRTQQVLHLPLEPFVSVAEPGDGRADHPHRLADAVVRAHRDRAPARLAGEPRAREGAASRRRLRRQGLHQARGAGRGARADRAPAGEDRAHDGGAVLHAHQAPDHVPHQERREPRTAASSRANARCWWNGGAYADIGPRVTQKSGFTAAGPYDIDNVTIDSYELYTNLPPAGALRGFGIPQLVWAYESHTDMIARALGIDPVEFRRKNILRDGRPQATGTMMRDAAIEPRARRARGADELERAVRARQRRRPPRPRHRHRLQGLDLADHVGRDRQRQRRRQRHAVDEHGRHGAGLRHRDGADRRRGAGSAHRGRARGASRHRRHALRHGHARLALDLPHGQRGQARGRGRARQAARARGRGWACRPAATSRSRRSSRSATACRPAT